jgi:hypothetical protein
MTRKGFAYFLSVRAFATARRLHCRACGGMTMNKPFRTSLTARGFTATAAFALLGGGLIPILGLSHAWLPLVLASAVGLAFGCLMAGANDHPGEVALLAILGPLAFFLYVCGALLVIQVAPSYAWILVALASVPVSLLAASLGSREAVPEQTGADGRAPQPLSA